ncbi:MAG: hypothetical protein FWF76_00905 [Oscillospiraceae bacterium]|nr:hypothetical protein [Oscillospiraceae bacterium]
MGIQFFWFYDVILVGILIGVIYRCTRQGFVLGITNLVGTLLGFAIALGISAPVASHIYDRFISPNVVEQISYMTESGQSDNSALAAFNTLREVDMARAYIDGVPLGSFLSAKVDNVLGEPLKLELASVDLSQTGITEGDLRFFGLEANLDFSEFSPVNVGNIDMTPAELARYDIADVILARAVSRRINERAVTSYETLTRNLNDTIPSVSRVISQGGIDVVSSLLLNVINNNAGSLEEAIDRYMVRPITMLPFRILVFSIVFALISVVISWVSRSMQIVDYIPLVGKVNTVLGGMLGLIMSTLIIFMMVIAVRATVSLTGDNLIFINNVAIEQTYIFRHVYSLSFLNF